MHISATIKSRHNSHETNVATDGNSKTISIAHKPSGLGSSINGAELLLLSLATCFCNDLYREAAKRKMMVTGVDVSVTGDFGAEGEPGMNFRYQVNVDADASPSAVQDLITYVDRIAEIHNTLRKGIEVTLIGKLL